MHENNTRPLTKNENLLRLLFEHADEIIDRLEFLNHSAQKLDRFEVLMNGFDGTPGLIETVEALTYEVNRVERRAGRSSSVDITSVCSRLHKVESQLEKLIVTESTTMKIQKDNLALLSRLTASMWLVSVLGLLSLFLLAWGAMASL